MFVSELHGKPAKSSVLVIDTTTWKTIKRFDNVGVDCQTMAPSYDGKYVFQIFSGFQRLEGGTFVFTQDTLEPVGYMPNFGAPRLRDHTTQQRRTHSQPLHHRLNRHTLGVCPMAGLNSHPHT